MATTQYQTISSTVYRPITLTVPLTITEHTEGQLLDDTLDVYYHEMHAAHGVEATVDTLNLFAAALTSGDALTCLYTHDGEVSARTLFPSAINLTKDKHICVRAFCTLRRETRSFRLDRLSGVHFVTMPGEVAPALPSEDVGDLIVGDEMASWRARATEVDAQLAAWDAGVAARA